MQEYRDVLRYSSLYIIEMFSSSQQEPHRPAHERVHKRRVDSVRLVVCALIVYVS